MKLTLRSFKQNVKVELIDPNGDPTDIDNRVLTPQGDVQVCDNIADEPAYIDETLGVETEMIKLAKTVAETNERTAAMIKSFPVGEEFSITIKRILE